MKNTEKAYTAGIIDGEGWIGTKNPGKNHGKRLLQVEVQSCDFDLIEWLHEKWGGYVVERPISENRKPSRAWRISGGSAAKVLSEIKPYIVMERRRERINEALKNWYKGTL